MDDDDAEYMQGSDDEVYSISAISHKDLTHITQRILDSTILMVTMRRSPEMLI